VVGLLNIVPAAAGGLPGIATAIETFRQDTFTALNLPISPIPPDRHAARCPAGRGGGRTQCDRSSHLPGLQPHIVRRVRNPDAIAQELAATGDPVRAVAAGVNTAAGEVTAAVTDVVDSVVTAVNNIRAASGQSLLANQATQPRFPRGQRQRQGRDRDDGTDNGSDNDPKAVRAKVGPQPRPVGTTTKHANAERGTYHPVRDAVSNVRKACGALSRKPLTGHTVLRRTEQARTWFYQVKRGAPGQDGSYRPVNCEYFDHLYFEASAFAPVRSDHLG